MRVYSLVHAVRGGSVLRRSTICIEMTYMQLELWVVLLVYTEHAKMDNRLDLWFYNL